MVGATLGALLGVGGCSAPNPLFGLDGDATEGMGLDGGGGDHGESDDGVDATGRTDAADPTDDAAGSGGGGADGGVDTDTGVALPVCGNGEIESGELCDDGVNDGTYGGCNDDCQSLAARCGDGTIDVEAGELCDDANGDPHDGCIADCTVPSSCLEIAMVHDDAEDGEHLIVPLGYAGDPLPVHCDMTTDGGGYTFVKLDPGRNHYAGDAEAVCNSLGMQLWIPRTEAHRDSGWAIANSAVIGPGAHPQYMRILGVYPAFDGALCDNEPLRSDNADCDWVASDDGPFFVHDMDTIDEPNGDNAVGGSMDYTWTEEGEIGWHNDWPGLGFFSSRFMCDVGDKI